MRLISTQRVQFIEVYGIDVPSYAILSHTWSDGEVLLQDLLRPDLHGVQWSAFSNNPPTILENKKVKGLSKLLGSTKLARQYQYEHLWVDTCCIDKTSSAELSEAINSMYRWYAGAEVCYAYLSDVPAADVESPFDTNSKFRQSRWFRRGWTLQELIAPQQVGFFASDWSYLGRKTGDIAFTKLLGEITGVQLDVLLGVLSPQDMSIATRMHWAAERQTTRIEDIAYCLLGIFDVNMPLLYGEGMRSFIRLQEAILIEEEDQSLFAWYSEELSANAVGDRWQSNRFSGLLADSPGRFRDENDFETAIPINITGSPSTVTSKGLQVDFLLLPCAGENIGNGADYRVVLNCERLRDGQRESPVIYLKRLWGIGDQFARVRSDLKTFIPPNIGLLQDGLQESIFVKQDPWSGMRTVRIMAAKDGSQLELPCDIGQRRITADWKIQDAWPRQGWAERVQTFQTRELTVGMPCVVLQLEIIESGRPRNFNVAIGMHATSERLCRSWCQILSFRPNGLEESFTLVTSKVKSGNIVYNSLSTQNLQGKDMASWIAVTEQNRKGRLDITLHVLSPQPLDETSPQVNIPNNDREEYGHIIPLSTLPEELSKDNALLLGHHFPYRLPTRKMKVWNAWQYGVVVLMGDLCVVDSIEISVFPRVPFGSKVRISSPDYPVSLRSLKEYCLNVLPINDKPTRSLVKILCGDDEGIDATDVQRYLDASRILEDKTDSFLQLTPVHWAVLGGKLKILNVLLDSGIDAVGTSEKHLTTLHLAFLAPPEIFHCMCGMLYPSEPGVDCSEILEHFESTSNNNDFPVHFAAAYAKAPEFWRVTTNQMYFGPQSNRLGERPIHRAAAMGNIAAVRYLSANKLRGVNDLDSQDRTPLWHAACSDHTGAISKILLDSGAFPNLADKDGLSPIHVACRQGTVGCLEMLIAKGASLNLSVGALGLLPTHFAALFGHKICLEMLLKGDAEVDSCPVEGARVYALHLAIANGQHACARAIWNSVDLKSEYRGWSLCILLESTGPVLKWMHVEVTKQYWVAVEDPEDKKARGNFVCVSEDNSTPKLWVRPGVVSGTSDKEQQSSSKDMVDEKGLAEAEDAGSISLAPENSITVLDGSATTKPKQLGKARWRITSVLGS